MDVVDRFDLPTLLAASEAMTLEGKGALVTYSRKIFIPLTQLCRDVCHYCTFAVPRSRRPAQPASICPAPTFSP
ncbi:MULTISPECIES: hypothetical protein [Sphingobium]|uniref:hypothetical protein n=1 Tax=Sphingobium sp. MI1205 TaxID=407020 RepID=UPI0007858ED5|nr:hypothetical protein [Sphingobium sp. MI1205]